MLPHDNWYDMICVVHQMFTALSADPRVSGAERGTWNETIPPLLLRRKMERLAD